MSARDVVVTVPMDLWQLWIEEGDLPGDEPTGEEWGFYTSGGRPNIRPGDRVYVVAHGRLRGYAPLSRLEVEGNRLSFGRKGGAVAVTIPESIRGFRGWRYRWWNRAIETSFEDWRTAGVRGQKRGKGERKGKGGPESEERSLDRVLEEWPTVVENSPSSGYEVGCRRCSARGVALLDPCMGVVDGGVHELVAV